LGAEPGGLLEPRSLRPAWARQQDSLKNTQKKRKRKSKLNLEKGKEKNKSRNSRNQSQLAIQKNQKSQGFLNLSQ
jgi:hypothetical protein